MGDDQPQTYPAIEIDSTYQWGAAYWRELWSFRELLFFLIWRDIKVRYKQTVLGAAWAVLQPFVAMVVFSLFFGKLAQVPSDDIPYPIFSYAALLPWMFFANGATLASNSMLNNTNLITKVYFPRLLVPSASVLSGTLDFWIAFTVLLGMMAFYGIWPTGWALLGVPLLFLLALVAGLGVSLWLSALNVQYRDIRYAAPFLIQLWLFATPVAYSSRMLSEPWRTIYGLNPMVGVVDGFRWVLLNGPPPGAALGVSALVAFVLLLSGISYFRRVEQVFADVV